MKLNEATFACKTELFLVRYNLDIFASTAMFAICSVSSLAGPYVDSRGLRFEYNWPRMNTNTTFESVQASRVLIE